jgi:hypothetical protein
MRKTDLAKSHEKYNKSGLSFFLDFPDVDRRFLWIYPMHFAVDTSPTNALLLHGTGSDHAD